MKISLPGLKLRPSRFESLMEDLNENRSNNMEYLTPLGFFFQNRILQPNFRKISDAVDNFFQFDK